MAVCLVILVALVYGNSLDGAFHFDDYPSIVDNELIRVESLSPRGLWAVAMGSPTSRPVSYVTFAVNYYLGGYDVTGYHLFNVSVHALTAVGFFFALLLFLRLPMVGLARSEGVVVAGVTAAVWAVHPMHVGAVTYIVQRMTLLATFFSVWGAVLLLQGIGEGGWKKWVFWGTAVLFFVLGVGSKEIAIALPITVVAVRFAMSPTRGWRRLLVAGGAMVVAGCVGFSIVWGVSGLISFLSRMVLLNPEQLLTVPRSFFYGLGLFLVPLPHRLSFEHDLRFSAGLLSPPTTIIALAGLLLLFASLIYFLRRGAIVPLLCLVWLLLPSVSELIAVKRNPFFEHRLYLPGMGVVLLAVFGAVTWMRRVTSMRLFAGCMACVIGVLGIATFKRNEVWKTPVTLGIDSVTKAPGKFRGYPDLIRGLVEAGRVREAEGFYQRLRLLEPGDAFDHYWVGISALAIGRYGDAVHAITACLDLNPGLCEPRQLLAEAHARSGNLGAALSELQVFNKLCRGRMIDPRARKFGAGLVQMAEVALEERILRDPQDTRSRFMLAGILLEKKRVGEAAEHYMAVLEAEPANAMAWTNLGFCYEDVGNLSGAEDAQRKALALAPSSYNAMFGLARVLEKRGSRNEALDYFRRYLSLAPPRDVFRDVAILRIRELEKFRD